MSNELKRKKEVNIYIMWIRIGTYISSSIYLPKLSYLKFENRSDGYFVHHSASLKMKKNQVGYVTCKWT